MNGRDWTMGRRASLCLKWTFAAIPAIFLFVFAVALAMITTMLILDALLGGGADPGFPIVTNH